ncbi:MAG: methylmalonyl-CoA mutase family protein, partial [Sandaracinaceae bacterium]|nr:methylmalonyl-CoA mutase family protein [Sandaracinaceae bacterium]
MPEPAPYEPKHPVRIVTAAALFDGHDAAINLMRRIMQATGAEIIHLGHNRSVDEVVQAAIQEDVQGVALTSYQGGHMEYFTYLRERLNAMGAAHVRIVGGGGGVIVPKEIEELHRRGIDRIFSPEDGRAMGLQGMINLVMELCDFPLLNQITTPEAALDLKLARQLTLAEQGLFSPPLPPYRAPVVGITGTGGAGKSSLTDELVRRFMIDFPEKRVAILCVDPTRKKTGGALLGDRIRINCLSIAPLDSNGRSRVFLRSLATRSGSEIGAVSRLLPVLQAHDFDLIFVETAGIGQGDSAITEVADVTIYVMTAEYGAPSQLEKIAMIEYADMIAINKFTKRGSLDALRDVRRQVARYRRTPPGRLEELMVFGTNAARFADPGVDALYAHLIAHLNQKHGLNWKSRYQPDARRVTDHHYDIVPPHRERYLSEIAETCRKYRNWVREQAKLASDIEALEIAIAKLGGPAKKFEAFGELGIDASSELHALMQEHDRLLSQLEPENAKMLREWDKWAERYQKEIFEYEVRGTKVQVETTKKSLSDIAIPKVAIPRLSGAEDKLLYRLLEGVPGDFPYTAGVFPFKRTNEDPTRMFAGEGPAERTNRRFHFFADGQPYARLSTAFDSITLYGEDPDERPDIFGKIGESGVSIFTVEEAEQLYAGFDLCHPSTSVSMTINGPAPTILAFFFNAAIRQQVRKYLREKGRLNIAPEQVYQPDRNRGARWRDVKSLLLPSEYEEIKAKALQQVRGTVQADILKEDQAQNTCIFSIDFALRMMGDVQEFFIKNKIRNFYSVSISGYHIAEAGANPIHQLA